MSATVIRNGRPPRKQLSDQLDRLDAILDGLAEALNEAAADAAREGVRLAVREVPAETRNQPELRARLIDPATEAPTPAAPVQPSLLARWKVRLAGWRVRVRDATRPVARRVTEWSEATRVLGLVLTAWACRRLAGLGLAAGLACLAVGCVTPPGVAVALGGGLTAVTVRVLAGVYRAVGWLPGGSSR